MYTAHSIDDLVEFGDRRGLVQPLGAWPSAREPLVPRAPPVVIVLTCCVVELIRTANELEKVRL